MGEVKLNIAFFGFNSLNLIEVIKTISCKLTNFAINVDEFDDIKPGIFEKEVVFKNKTRSLYIMADFPKSEDDYIELLNNFEINNLEIKKYLKKKFKKEIDYYFLVYDEKIQILIEYLISISNNNYCLIMPKNTNLKCKLIENNIINNLEDPSIDNKVFKFFDQIYSLYPKFEEFIKCSKEKYYNKFNKYFRRFYELNSKSEKELFELFNSFELYSFDSNDYNDDSIIILQILCNKNCKQISCNVEQFFCQQCKMKKRSLFDKKKKLFLCEKCNPNNKPKGNYVRCEKCKQLINKDESPLYIITFCCNKCYCSFCIKNQIIPQVKKKATKIKCFCGENMYDGIIDYILGEEYQNIFNDNALDDIDN